MPRRSIAAPAPRYLYDAYGRCRLDERSCKSVIYPQPIWPKSGRTPCIQRFPVRRLLLPNWFTTVAQLTL